MATMEIVLLQSNSDVDLRVRPDAQRVVPSTMKSITLLVDSMSARSRTSCSKSCESCHEDRYNTSHIDCTSTGSVREREKKL